MDKEGEKKEQGEGRRRIYERVGNMFVPCNSNFHFKIKRYFGVLFLFVRIILLRMKRRRRKGKGEGRRREKGRKGQVIYQKYEGGMHEK